MSRALIALSTAGLLACSPMNLQAASPYSSLIVFGDSLSDAGWFSDSNGPKRFTNRVGPTYQPGEAYAPVSPMLLGSQLGLSAASLESAKAGGDNWAVGGDRTDQIYNTVINQYLASRGGRADPQALYYLTGGGNDFLQLRITNPASAQVSAGQLVDSVRALNDAGAKHIMVWLLPDVAQTPAMAGTALAPLVSQLGQAFNQELVSQLAGLNANVIPLNIPLMLSEVLAEPERYGLATDIPAEQLITTCFDDCSSQNTRYGLSSATADPSKLLFNDGVHPTITGQRLIADYAYSLLAAPWQVSLLPEMAHGTQRAQQDMLRNLWQSEQNDWQALGQWRSFVNASGQRQDYDIYALDAKGNGLSVALGASYRWSDIWRAGLAVSLTQQHLKADHSGSDYELLSYLASAFAQYQQGRQWADITLSAGYLDYDSLKREFSMGEARRQEKADSNGHLWSLNGRLGYELMAAGSVWQVSPFISADYTRVVVDRYSEKSQGASALNVAEQKRNSKRAGVGLQSVYNMTEQTRWFGEVSWEHEFNDDAAQVGMSLRSLPGIAYELEGYRPEDHWWRASLGVKHDFSDAVRMRAGYSYRHAADAKQQGINLSLIWDL